MRKAIVLAAAALVLALAACGDSGDGAQSRKQFIAKTDELCSASNERTRALNRELRDVAASSRTDAELLRRLAPILERGYGTVRDNATAFQAANPPAADDDRIEAIRATYDRQAEIGRRIADAAKRGDTKRFRSLSQQSRKTVTQARRLTRDYGFRECGSSASDAP